MTVPSMLYLLWPEPFHPSYRRSVSPISEVCMTIAETAARIRANVQKVIVGKGEVIDLALVAVLCEGHILIEDVPGIGKTTLAKALAASLGLSFRRIQFTPDLLPSDVTGVNVFNQKTQD